MSGSQIGTSEELAIEAGLNALLVLPTFAFLNAPVLKQLYLFFGKKLVMFVYGGMKLLGYEINVDVKVDGKNGDYVKSKDELKAKIDQGASNEEIAIARKKFIDDARKLIASGRDIVQG